MDSITVEILDAITKIKDLKQSRPLTSDEMLNLLIASLMEEENT